MRHTEPRASFTLLGCAGGECGSPIFPGPAGNNAVEGEGELFLECGRGEACERRRVCDVQRSSWELDCLPTQVACLDLSGNEVIILYAFHVWSCEVW